MISCDQRKCVGCGICVGVCPADALSVWSVARVAEDRCTECLECIDYCPADALEMSN